MDFTSFTDAFTSVFVPLSKVPRSFETDTLWPVSGTNRKSNECINSERNQTYVTCIWVLFSFSKMIFHCLFFSVLFWMTYVTTFYVNY